MKLLLKSKRLLWDWAAIPVLLSLEEAMKMKSLWIGSKSQGVTVISMSPIMLNFMETLFSLQFKKSLVTIFTQEKTFG